MRKKYLDMVKAAVLLDQSLRDWRGLDCIWQHSGKPYEFPDIVDTGNQAECYLVIAAANQAALSGLANVQGTEGFDPNKPVIWIDLTTKIADIFGSTSLLMSEIWTKERENELNIRRLIAHLLGSSLPIRA